MLVLDTNWADVSRRLKHRSLKLTIAEYKEVCGETLKGKKKDETVLKANKICQVSEINLKNIFKRIRVY